MLVICIKNIIFQLEFRNVKTCSLSRKQPLLYPTLNLSPLESLRQAIRIALS